jgi:hypothetical protein
MPRNAQRARAQKEEEIHALELAKSLGYGGVLRDAWTVERFAVVNLPPGIAFDEDSPMFWSDARRALPLLRMLAALVEKVGETSTVEPGTPRVVVACEDLLANGEVEGASFAGVRLWILVLDPELQLGKILEALLESCDYPWFPKNPADVIRTLWEPYTDGEVPVPSADDLGRPEVSLVDGEVSPENVLTAQRAMDLGTEGVCDQQLTLGTYVDDGGKFRGFPLPAKVARVRYFVPAHLGVLPLPHILRQETDTMLSELEQLETQLGQADNEAARRPLRAEIQHTRASLELAVGRLLSVHATRHPDEASGASRSYLEGILESRNIFRQLARSNRLRGPSCERAESPTRKKTSSDLNKPQNMLRRRCSTVFGRSSSIRTW